MNTLITYKKAPEALDISGEPNHIRRLYGLDHNIKTWPKEINEIEEIDYFARKCLVARRLLTARRFAHVHVRHDEDRDRPHRR